VTRHTRERRFEVAAGHVDLEIDSCQAGGHARSAERDAEQAIGGVAGCHATGVAEVIGRADDRQLLAKRLILALDDRAVALAWVVDRLIGGRLAAVRSDRVAWRAKTPVITIKTV
jgi:hypothetical protein